jgi:hypothetical protein
MDDKLVDPGLAFEMRDRDFVGCGCETGWYGSPDVVLENWGGGSGVGDVGALCEVVAFCCDETGCCKDLPKVRRTKIMFAPWKAATREDLSSRFADTTSMPLADSFYTVPLLGFRAMARIL